MRKIVLFSTLLISCSLFSNIDDINTEVELSRKIVSYFTDFAGLLFLAIILAGIILITRLLGAWMLRINDVIKELKEIKDELKKNNS